MSSNGHFGEVPQRPRVGHIQFLNCLPLYWGLARSGALLDVVLTKDTPDRLNDALVAGELDIGPISLVEYLRHADELLVLPDLAVGSDGPVLSVCMVSTVPIDQIRSVALGSTSRTSVLLARLLLEQDARPVAVVHGDAARSWRRCCARRTRPWSSATPRCGRPSSTGRGAGSRCSISGLRGTRSPACRWSSPCGPPAVTMPSAHPEQVKEVAAAFRASLDLALAQVDEVARDAARWEEFEPDLLARYFTTLDFSLGPRQQEGIREFAKRAAAAGEVPPLAEIRFATV